MFLLLEVPAAPVGRLMRYRTADILAEVIAPMERAAPAVLASKVAASVVGMEPPAFFL